MLQKYKNKRCKQQNVKTLIKKKKKLLLNINYLKIKLVVQIQLMKTN